MVYYVSKQWICYFVVHYGVLSWAQEREFYGLNLILHWNKVIVEGRVLALFVLVCSLDVNILVRCISCVLDHSNSLLFVWYNAFYFIRIAITSAHAQTNLNGLNWMLKVAIYLCASIWYYYQWTVVQLGSLRLEMC